MGTCDNYKRIADLTKNNGTAHLIGIGGVSMRSLAELLHDMGANVRGSDRASKEVLEKLGREGITVFFDHDARNISGADIVIKTSAVHDDNPELAEAVRLGIPVITRAQAWGALMSEYGHRLCIAGTHGKTTATGMAACAAISAGLDPTVMIGGELPAIGGAFRKGGKRLFIAESCEYCNSYHEFRPSVAVILNVEADHLDFFGGIDDIVESFGKFAANTDRDGAVVAYADDPHAMKAARLSGRKVVTFGLHDGADVYPQELSEQHGFYSFTICAHGAEYARIKLAVPGVHNVLNALACAAAFEFMGVDGDKFAAGLAEFAGTGRRFENRGRAKSGALVIDDYAHHPSEIKATLCAARKLDVDRIFCVFQPHTYSRTKALLNDFARELAAADVPILTDIYAARETDTCGVSAKDVADRIDGAEYIKSFEDICEFLGKNTGTHDLIITMGAGDVYKIAQMLTEKQACVSRAPAQASAK